MGEMMLLTVGLIAYGVIPIAGILVLMNRQSSKRVEDERKRLHKLILMSGRRPVYTKNWN